MELALKHQLNQLVTEYRQWLKANFSIEEIDQNLTDESAYPQWQDIESFFKKNPTKGITMSLAQTLEKISINIAYMDRMRKEFS